MTATRSVKKARPAFDVARTALDEPRTAWVYRSDVPSSPTARDTAPVEPSAGAGGRPSAQPASTPARSAPGWIETGVGVMVMPFTLAIMALIAPAVWIDAARPRR